MCDQDAGLFAINCILRRKHWLAGDDAWASWQANEGGLDLESRVHCWAANHLELPGREPRPGSAFVDHPLVHKVNGDLERGAGRALASARLENEQLTILDRELQVHNVHVHGLQLVAQLLKFAAPSSVHIVQLEGRADARHHVFALSIEQVLAH